MRVCFIGKYPPNSKLAGGIEKYTEDLLSSNEVEFEPIFFGAHLPVNFTILESPFSSPQLFFDALSKTKADILHINIPNPFGEIMLLLHIIFKGKRQKIVATYHADAPHYTITSYLADALRMLWLVPLLKLCDKIISTSHQYAATSFALKMVMNKVKIVPLGIDTENISLSKSKASGNKIIFIGRLYRYKGLNVLLHAFKKLLNKRDAELFIVGDGPLKEKLVRQTKKLQIENNVMFTGRLDGKQKNKLLNETDIFVLPSINRGEAFGMSQLEAMYLCKPVISTNIKGSGVTFVNKNGETGIVVEPKNAGQLANAMLELLNNENLRNKMGKKGRERVLKYFTRDRMIEETIKIYKSLV